MITISLPINLSKEDQDYIFELQKLQSPMIRSAYKFACDNLKEIEVRGKLRDRFDGILDSWYQQSAVKYGMGQAKADKELGVFSRIFGGKKNLIRRSSGYISNEEWKECRLTPLYLIGESPAYGNRKFDFFVDRIIFKPFKSKKIEIILPNMRKNYMKMWAEAVRLSLEKEIPITISLTKFRINITFDNKRVKTSINKFQPPVKNRYAGVDLNPNYIGISIYDNHVLVSTRLFSLKDLTGKNINENKLQHETIEIGHSIGKWLKSQQVDFVFCEKLTFDNASLKSKNLNRLCKNQWKKTVLLESINKYFKIYYVNAAYSSTIGNVLNTTLPDPVAASAEIARRGFEIVIQKSKKFYPELPTKEYLQDLWKETEIFSVKTWKELHDWIKNAKLKYRVPLPPVESFRIFQSRHSRVGVL